MTSASSPNGGATTNGNGTSKKREAASSPPAESNKKVKTDKDQKTIEETLNGASEGVESEQEISEQIKTDKKEEDTNKSEELEAREKAVQKREEELAKKEGGVADSKNGGEENAGGKKEENALEEVKSDAPAKTNPKKVNESEEAANGDQDQGKQTTDDLSSDDRASQIPSSILEKGLIYFFFRSRVGVSSPQGVEDIARSYIVLRPLELGSSLASSAPLKDTKNARLLALPKKVLPKSTRDRFLMFVEKTGASIEELKAVFEGDEYATKTQGTSQVPAVTPFAEGIYAITSTNSGRDSHLAYHLTTPSSLGEIQKTLGLVNPKGSYAVSLKNPEAPGPANATLSNPAEYPAEIQDQFSGRRWMPLIPAALEYDNTQFLVIGEGEGDALEEAKDGDERKETAEEEMEKLEDEDEERIQHLKGDDPVFADLGLSSEEFKGLQTTW